MPALNELARNGSRLEIWRRRGDFARGRRDRAPTDAVITVTVNRAAQQIQLKSRNSRGNGQKGAAGKDTKARNPRSREAAQRPPDHRGERRLP